VIFIVFGKSWMGEERAAPREKSIPLGSKEEREFENTLERVLFSPSVRWL